MSEPVRVRAVVRLPGLGTAAGEGGVLEQVGCEADLREVFCEGEGGGRSRIVVGGGGFFRELEAGVADDVQ
jgi:hypothetical protein